jgi:spermidine synthase
MPGYPYQLYAGSFFAGFATMAYEMLLGRALVPYFGGTIYTWGALISTFLLGMSLGFVLGGRLSIYSPNYRWLGVLSAFGGILICLTPPFLEPVCLFLLEHFTDVRIPAIIAAGVFAFVPASLFAAISPLCVRLGVDDLSHAGSVAGWLSALNTVGSIVGTLSTSFFLVPFLGTRTIFVLLGLLSICVGVFLGLGDRRRNRSGRNQQITIAPVVLICAMFVAHDLAARPGEERGDAPLVAQAVLESVESEYNNIFVVQQGNQRIMTFGYRGSHYTESVYDQTHPRDLVVKYTRYMTLGLIYPDKLERGAFVGLGGGRTASYVVRTVPDFQFDVAELDKEVIRLAQQYFGIEQSERLRIFPQDGRVYLTRSKDTYDIVFLDAYRGPFVPFHLLTKEFFSLIKSRLRPNGVVVQNVEPTTMLLDSAVVTIKSVFPNVDVYQAGGNIVLIGYSGVPFSLEALKQKAETFNQRFRPLYDPAEMLSSRQVLEISPKAKVLTDDFAPVEMLHTIKRHNEKRQ